MIMNSWQNLAAYLRKRSFLELFELLVFMKMFVYKVRSYAFVMAVYFGAINIKNSV